MSMPATKSLLLYSKSQRAHLTLQTHLSTQRAALEGFSDLRALQTVIKKHGLTKALMAFANHNARLSTVVTDLPSVESLNNVPLSKQDKRYGIALEGLETTLGQEPVVIGSWVKQVAGELGELLSTTAASAHRTDEDLSELSARLSDLDPQAVLYDTLIVTARTATGTEAILSTVADHIRKIGTVDVDALFTSSAYREANDAFMQSQVEEFKPFLGVSIDADRFVHAGADAIDEAYQPREASLTDLGYSTETLIDLMSKAMELVAAIVELDDRREAITAALDAVADRLTTTDETQSAADCPIEEAHRLILNYATVISMLIGDGLFHVHEFLSVGHEAVQGHGD